MRKHLLIITFALTACIAANAQSVSKDVAAAKATSFLQLKSDSQLQLLKSPYDNLYLFSIDGGASLLSVPTTMFNPSWAIRCNPISMWTTCRRILPLGLTATTDRYAPPWRMPPCQSTAAGRSKAHPSQASKATIPSWGHY